MSELGERLKARAKELGSLRDVHQKDFLSFAAEVLRKATYKFEWGCRSRGIIVSARNLYDLADELEKSDE